MKKIAEFEFKSEKNIAELKRFLILHFNLNPERKSKYEDFFKYENKKYEGKLNSDNSFFIKANKLNLSENNGIDFFFTNIKGKILEKDNKSIIKLEAELDKGLTIVLLLSIPIYLIITYFSFSSGIFGIILFTAFYFYGRIKVKEDLETIKNELKNYG